MVSLESQELTAVEMKCWKEVETKLGYAHCTESGIRIHCPMGDESQESKEKMWEGARWMMCVLHWIQSSRKMWAVEQAATGMVPHRTVLHTTLQQVTQVRVVPWSYPSYSSHYGEGKCLRSTARERLYQHMQEPLTWAQSSVYRTHLNVWINECERERL
jgi:hypothetical protein